LDQAISPQMEALALHSVGHTGQSVLLDNLANQLSTRFDHRGNAEDLKQAIALQREALALHTDYPHPLSNIATHLSTHFDHRGDGEDLEEVIALQREALALHPVGHTDRFRSLTNLAT
jgi:hypothetical protein